MTLEALRGGRMIMLAGLNQNSRNLPFVKAIVEMMQDSKLIEVNDDDVIFKGFYIGDMNGRAQTAPPSSFPGRKLPEKRHENGGWPNNSNSAWRWSIGAN